MRSVKHCFNKQLADLCQRSIQLEELSAKVKLLLPFDLAQNSEVGSFNKGCLVLTTSDPNWASQLRYALPELRDKLRQEAGFYQLLSIKINLVEPVMVSQKAKTVVVQELSDEGKACIIRESQHCTYEPLQQALLNLAREE